MNVLFGTRYTDLCYGYNAFWPDCLTGARPRRRGPAPATAELWGDGFEIETIINTRVAKAGLRIVEVPSFEYARMHGQSNLNTWRDGFRVLTALLVERFNHTGRHMWRPSTLGATAGPRPTAHTDLVAVRLVDARSA